MNSRLVYFMALEMESRFHEKRTRLRKAEVLDFVGGILREPVRLPKILSDPDPALFHPYPR